MTERIELFDFKPLGWVLQMTVKTSQEMYLNWPDAPKK